MKIIKRCKIKFKNIPHQIVADRKRKFADAMQTHALAVSCFAALSVLRHLLIDNFVKTYAASCSQLRDANCVFPFLHRNTMKISSYHNDDELNQLSLSQY